MVSLSPSPNPMPSFLFSKPFLHLHSKTPFFHHFPMSSLLTKCRLCGVVFDMDGTLTVPTIDFPAMYKVLLGDDKYKRVKAQNPSGIDILHHIESWSLDKQRKAYQIIADFEKQGLDCLQIMPGAAELCGFLDGKKIRRGLVTRNVKESVDLFHQRFGVACGKQAGALTCLLDEKERYSSKDFAKLNLTPDFKVSSLNDVYTFLESNFDLAP